MTICNVCCVGLVVRKMEPGRTAILMGRRVPIPDDFPIRTCDSCGEVFITRQEARALERALENAGKPSSVDAHQQRWLSTQDADSLRERIRKNSCLCDMAGICNGCQLADTEARIREMLDSVGLDAAKELERTMAALREIADRRER